MIRDTLSWIRSLAFSIPMIVLVTVVATTLALAASVVNRRDSFRERCQRLWARFILAVSFVHVTVQGEGKLNPSQTYIFCVNHLSYLDPPVLLARLQIPVRFLAKKSLFAIPFLGWAMRWEGDLPMDRENLRAAAQSLARAADLASRGTSLVVFPEGGRSLDGKLQPFHSGGFRLAIRAQVPVVPIAIQGTYSALRPGSLHIRGGLVQLAIGEPIPTQGLSEKDKDRLTTQVEETIRRTLQDLSKTPGVRSEAML